MDVRTPDTLDASARTVVRYSAAATVLALVLLVPAVVFEPYARWVAVLWLALAIGLAVRGTLSACFAFVEPQLPPECPGDLPTVSVIVTAYNEADVLPQTIDACRHLDYPTEKLDVVLCYESASTDGTAAIAERAATEHSQVMAVERTASPGGKATITNDALGTATGEIVAVIDADQRFEPDAVRRAARWFRADDEIWCVKGRCFGDNPLDSLVSRYATVDRHLVERAEFVARDRLYGFTLFTGGQAFFRARLFDELGNFDETVLLEDVDMACRIHAAGHEIRVDPAILSYERVPTQFASWWSQRKRWARGGMQLARRYFFRLPRERAVPVSTKLDAIYTFGYVLLLPLLALAFPVALLGRIGLTAGVGSSFEAQLWAFLALVPVFAAGLVFVRDYSKGRAHDGREWLAVLTLWPYVALQSLVVVAAFLEEFVFESPVVYVTSTPVAAGEDGD